MELLKTQPNEARCRSTEETHELPFDSCCPMTGNPMPGSRIEITYKPDKLLLEVESLRRYVDSYQGGKDDIRSMEGMVQAITQDSANALRTSVWVVATLIIRPNQKMILRCAAHSKNGSVES